jgi:FkbM family methyltransferase
LDVGAAAGDTVLLLKQKCPGQIKQFVCFEGDEEFFKLLESNTATFDDVQAVHVLLASQETTIRSLVKHHPGTAAALGEESVDALPLDVLDRNYIWDADIIKVDVDGYDGEVIGGAQGILKRRNPVVIFEWHPKLISDTRTDPFSAFQVLADCGYKRCLWFNNVGTFSHFSGIYERETIERARNYLLTVNRRADAHFDIVALPSESNIDEVALAAMDFARQTLSKISN